MGSRLRAWTVTGLIGSIHFVQHVFRILPPILPFLTPIYPYPLWQFGALVGIYFAGSGFGQVPMGMLADRYDRRLLLPPSLAMMGGGYLLFALAPQVSGSGVAVSVAGTQFAAEYLVMSTGALVAGLGASAVHPCGYPIAIANAPKGRQGRSFGAWASAAKMGDAIAPLSVGALLLIVSWSDVFLLFGAVGILYAVVLFRGLSSGLVDTRPTDNRAQTTTDNPGHSSESSDDDLARGKTPGFRDDNRNYVYPFVALSVFFVVRGFTEKGLKAFLPTFVATVYAYTVTVRGVRIPAESLADAYFTAVFVVAAASVVAVGLLVDRFDARTVLIVCFLVAVATLVTLATGTLSPVALLVLLGVFGASNWGLAPARDAITSDITPPSHEGRAFGSLHTISHLTSAVAPVAIGALAGVLSFRQAFVVLAAVMLLGVIAIGSLYSRRVYLPVDHGRGVTGD
jgi:MFS family permease